MQKVDFILQLMFVKNNEIKPMDKKRITAINNSKAILIVFLFFGMLFGFSSQAYAQKKYVVVLDAGHGGKDPGKVGHKNIKEKEVVLDLVLRVGRILETKPNIKVIYTRKKDEFIGLAERGKIANKANADLFVSIHCNAHHTDAEGTETWVLGTHANNKNFEVAKMENAVILLEDNYEVNYKGFDPNSPESLIGLTLMQEEYLDQSIALASLIQDEFTNELKRVNRGVKQAGFVVLHQTYMPSILIEAGFLTNKKEAMYVNSRKGRQQISNSIASGIEKYIAQLDLNTVEKEERGGVTQKNMAESDINTTKTVDNEEEKYKVVIASSRRKLETKHYNFKGLKGVERIKKGPYYRYYFGSSKDFKEANKNLEIAKSRGYRTAYLITLNDGKENMLTKDIGKQRRAVTKVSENQIIFRVQLVSGKSKIELTPTNFNGLKNVERLKVGENYKYFYGKEKNYLSIKKYQQKARENGYSAAFVVAFKGDMQIGVKEAIGLVE